MNIDTGDDNRTADQKRADVLIDLDDLETGQGATFEDSTPMPASAFERFTDQAIVFYLFGRRINGHFLPLAVARDKRFATQAQWKALIARDRGCLNCGNNSHPRNAAARQGRDEPITGWTRA